MSELVVEKNESVLVIKFNRPSKKNALTISMYEELTKIFLDAQHDEEVRVLVLASTSDTFSAGNDLVDFINNPPLEDDAPVYTFVRTVTKFTKPIVAAVDGLGVGIGLTILLHCDFVYITDRAKLMAPFVNLGLVPELGSSKLLVDLIGERKAAKVFLLGEALSGKEAVDSGLATDLVTPEELEGKTLATAKALSEKPQESLRQAIGLMRPVADVMKVVEAEISIFKKQVISDDAKEAFNAILEKRKPQFK